MTAPTDYSQQWVATKTILDVIRYEEVDALVMTLIDLSHKPDDDFLFDGETLTQTEVWNRAVTACLNVLDERLAQLCAG